MNLILLAGNSIDNKEWLKKAESVLKPHFDSIQIQYYDHWRLGRDLIDLAKEVKKLAKTTKSKKQYVVLAKSAGNVIASKAIYEKKISPRKCIFIGIPLDWARKHGFDIGKWFKNFSVPSIIIQHSHDPIATPEELSEFLKRENATNYDLVELPGDDHYYQELDKIKDLVVLYLGKVRTPTINGLDL